MDELESPQLKAMREAMKQAEEAAEKRRLAKLKAREAEAAQAPMSLDDLEDWEVLRETMVVRETLVAPVEAYEDEDDGPAFQTFDIAGTENLEAILQALDETIPDYSPVEKHGDLLVFKHEDQAKPWYTLAAEEALPEALRGIKGPLDVKRLIQAVIVEVGDVKRTNALIMEQLLRLEEKMDRTNRLLRDRRYH